MRFQSILRLLQLQFLAILTNGAIPWSGDPFADQFPTLEETSEMSKLSKLVYRFRHEDDDYCDGYTESGVHCKWYFHDKGLGTQVLLVTNPHRRYIAVVFAGTDDLRTALEDVNIVQQEFGNNATIRLEDPNIKVHAGFNNAVFSNGIYDEISSRVKQIHRMHPFFRIWTTGHSLGAANSILTATGLAIEGYTVTSVNFGCPQIGNTYWRDFFQNPASLKGKLAVWRVVLGWDLVARLPDHFFHVGHTIQIWSEKHQKYDKHATGLVEAYYQHYGDYKLYAGVPSGWGSKPYVWVPGALTYHFMQRYLDFLDNLLELNIWVDGFKALQPIGYDDDIYDEPPDDWLGIEEFVVEGENHVTSSSSSSSSS